MILLIQDRKNNLHLVDYTPPSGNKFTICGIVYYKKEIMNTLALDAAVHNICRTCYEDYETMYGDDLENDIRMAHSSLNERLSGKFRFPSFGAPLPEIEYWDLTNRRSDKIIRYQRKLSRK